LRESMREEKTLDFLVNSAAKIPVKK